MSIPSRSVRLLGALALILAGCVDGSDPTGIEPLTQVSFAAVPSFSPGSAPVPADAPLTHAHVIARAAETGEVMGETLVALEADAPEWSIEITLEIPVDRTVRLSLLIQLLSVQDGVEAVQWSGRTGQIAVSSALPPAEIRQVTMYRGPPGNLDVSAVRIESQVAELTEGDSVRLGASVEGGGEGAVVFFTSLDPDIAGVTSDGLVTAFGTGVARIRAEAGPRADTLAIGVRSFPLPPQKDVDALTPAVSDGVGRLLPTLGNQAAAGVIAGALQDVTDALAARQGLAAKEALGRAWDAVRAYGGAGASPSDTIELSLVELMLLYIERLLR